MFAVAVVAIVLAAAALCRRQTLRAAAERRDLLRDCAALFDAEPDHGVDRAGFGFLAGDIRGLRVHVGLLAESLAFRRLPQLWLMIEVRAEMGGSGVLTLVRRPVNAAVTAPAPELARAHAVPPGWPADTLIRGTPDSEPLLRRLAGHAAPLLGDERLKDLLLTPRGLRVSSQVREGERGAYLLLRGSRFRTGRIGAPHIRGVVHETVALAHALRRRDERDAGHDTLRSITRARGAARA